MFLSPGASTPFSECVKEFYSLPSLICSCCFSPKISMGKKEGEDPVHSESKFLNVVIFPISGMPGRLSFQMQERWVVLKAAVLVLIRDLWLFIL